MMVNAECEPKNSVRACGSFTRTCVGSFFGSDVAVASLNPKPPPPTRAHIETPGLVGEASSACIFMCPESGAAETKYGGKYGEDGFVYVECVFLFCACVTI